MKNNKLKLNIQYFASSNHTVHYDLSQYTANDKPTYLIDYNGDMAKIDAGIYEANSRSLVNESAIGTLSNLGTTAKSDLVSAINEVNTQVGANTTNIGINTANISTLGTNMGDLINLTTVAKNNLVSAINELKGVNDTQNTNIGDLSQLETVIKSSLVGAINEIQEYFNIKNFTQIQNSDISVTGGTLSYNNLNTALNDDGTLGKIYGKVSVNKTSDTLTLTINTNIRPSETITINTAIIFTRTQSTTNAVDGLSLSINPSGVATITLLDGSRGTIILNLLPCLYFFKNFGDTPIQP